MLSQVYWWLQNNWEEVVILVGSLWAAAEVVVRLTPTKKDDGAMKRLGTFVDKLLIKFPNLKKKDPQ